MAYETELLPQDTSLFWNPATHHFRCVQQGDATFFIHNNVPIGNAQFGPQYLTDRRGTALVCGAIGLTQDETAAYLGISPYTVHAHMSEVYREVGVQTPVRLGAGHNHALHAFSRLAQQGVIELGSRAELAYGPPSNTVIKYAEGHLQGMSVEKISDIHGVTKDSVRGRMRYRAKKEGCKTIEAYVLRLLAAKAIGEINYRPELMQELPTLTTAPETLGSQLAVRAIAQTERSGQA